MILLSKILTKFSHEEHFEPWYVVETTDLTLDNEIFKLHEKVKFGILIPDSRNNYKEWKLGMDKVFKL